MSTTPPPDAASLPLPSRTRATGRRAEPALQSALTRAQQEAVAQLMTISPVADTLGKLFADNGFELHLVGGSVRDALLGRLGNDLDFTTDARPPDIQRIVAPWADSMWDTGIAFGTVGATKSGYVLEITTYRSDLYDGDSRNPEVTFGDDLEHDLVRRDFTVNAMAVSVPGHVFTDPFRGLEDLAARRLDTPGTPEQSFGDDPLRMLRAVRFVAQIDLVPTPRVVEAITDDGPAALPDHHRTDPGRAGQADLRAARARRPGAADGDRTCRADPAGTAWRCRWRPTNTTSTRTSTSTR